LYTRLADDCKTGDTRGTSAICLADQYHEVATACKDLPGNHAR